MKYLLMVSVCFFCMAAVPAMGVKRTGHDLLVDCTNLVETESIETIEKEKLLGMGYCIGLIDGLVTFNYIYEAVLVSEESGKMVQMCLPDRVSTRELAKVIVRYLESNQEKGGNSGQALAAQALTDAYPCDSGTIK